MEKGNRGGSPAAYLLRMRRLEADRKPPARGVASAVVWKAKRPSNYDGVNSYKACAVAGDRVLAAYSIEGRDSHRLTEPRHRLAVREYETGNPVQELYLPAPALYAGLAVADGAVYAVTEDGTVTSFR